VSPRRALSVVFAAHGVALGSWVAHIPSVKHELGVSNGALGAILLVLSAGSIATVPAMGQLVARRGSALGVRIAGAATCALVALPLLMPGPVTLALALLAFGAAVGSLDVAMNTHAAALEEQLGRPAMSSWHAAWSVGGVAGSGWAALGTAVGVDPRAQVGLAAIVMAGGLAFALPAIGPGRAGAGTAAARLQRPTRAAATLAGLCLLAMVAQGSMADWGGLYLRDTGSSAGLAAAAYAAFSCGILAGRLLGDRAVAAFSATTVVRGGAALAALVLGAVLAAGAPLLAFGGFVLVGLGLANCVPLFFGAAARVPDMAPGPAMAAVSALSTSGFLVGPPVLGILADGVGLPLALAALCAACGAVALLGGRMPAAAHQGRSSAVAASRPSRTA
jgi:hypothetical protein